MTKRIGIISEGVTDFKLLNEIVIKVLDLTKNCFQLCPICDKPGGWGNIWRYCNDNIYGLGVERFMRMTNSLDAIIISIDGDVSREKTLYCYNYGKPEIPFNIECNMTDNAYECYNLRNQFGRYIPCEYRADQHPLINNGNLDQRDIFIKSILRKWINKNEEADLSNIILTVPFDMIESWIVCALDGPSIDGIQVESYAGIFRNYIRRQSTYHGMRISTEKSDTEIKKAFFDRFVLDTVSNWNMVTSECRYAQLFHNALLAL